MCPHQAGKPGYAGSYWERWQRQALILVVSLSRRCDIWQQDILRGAGGDAHVTIDKAPERVLTDDNSTDGDLLGMVLVWRIAQKSSSRCLKPKSSPVKDDIKGMFTKWSNKSMHQAKECASQRSRSLWYVWVMRGSQALIAIRRTIIINMCSL